MIKMKWESKQNMLEILLLLLYSKPHRKPSSSFSSLYLGSRKISESFSIGALQKYSSEMYENSKKRHLMEFSFCQFAATMPATAPKRTLISQVCNDSFGSRRFRLVALMTDVTSDKSVDFFSIL